MYKIKDIVYAEAGYLLKGKRKMGFHLIGNLVDFTEERITLNDMHLENETVVCNNGMFHWIVYDARYSSLKKWAIGLRYTNDDQIAIMLNRDDDEDGAFAFQKMQEWREWASVVAKKIMEVIESNNNKIEDYDNTGETESD